jgi:transcriptional regulator with PAS, ATPase and Fis domain
MLDETKRDPLSQAQSPLQLRPFTQRPRTAHLQNQATRPTEDGAPQPEISPGSMVIAWQEPGRIVERVVLSEGLLSIGSHPDNSLVLQDAQVSRFHCRLHAREDGTVWLRDLGSRNGSLVDGVRVVEIELSPGARITLGTQALRIERQGVMAALDALPGMVARDPIMAPVVALLRKAAPSRLPVTLRGETGTGKEVAARALHALSPRAQGPFIAINCGAIAADLAEAELFGHERGAFTGAIASAPGAFGAADGGTLFLDEIGELPLSLQVKLLRALESDEVKPVGAARSRKVDVRILCATHRDLRKLVQGGEFREDLFYRLQGVEIVLPPLRARPRDILAIAEKVLAREAEGVTLTAEARSALLSHPWPGNARELIHTLRLALLLREGNHLHADDLRLELPPEDREEEPDDTSSLTCSEPFANYGSLRTLGEMEESAVRSAYKRHGGHRRAMCDELGVSKSSLLRKLNGYGLR